MRRDTALRIGLLVLAVFVLGVFIFSVPIYIAQLRTVCAGSGCNADQLTEEGARSLGELGLSMGAYAAAFSGITIASALVWFGVAAVIAWLKFDDGFALFVALTLVLVGAFSVTGSVDAGSSSWWLAIRAVNGLELACFILFLCLFPDGKFVPRWTMSVAIGAAALGVASVAFPENPLGPLWFVFAGSLVGAQVYRYRHVSALVQRQQTKWVVFAFAMVVLTVLGMFLVTQVLSPSGVLGVPPSLILTPIAYAVLLSIPLSIGIAILRYRLWDIDLVINRTFVYGALTALVIGLYVLVVGGLGVLLRVQGNLLVSILAAGLVAVLFQPLRVRLQRAVNHFMYGERDDPYAVLSRLGERLEATLAPKAVLPIIVETVVQALKVPHAEISLQREDGFETAAQHGTLAGEPLVLPLVYQNETVGRLAISPRAKDEPFTPADRRLLEDLARQAGVAAYAVRLTTDLQRSRERLVTAREEERLRLRRDFHDGIGPQLAALTLKIETARNRLGSDPTARDMLSDLAERARATVAEVRRSVHALRPPALDELGLVPALRETAAQYSQNGLWIHVKAPDELPPLPAAVEVAAYRIAQEALTNVVRHAGAQECTVRFRLDEKAGLLRLEVEDDGRGMGRDSGSGVGLSSMRERAEELGGACVFEPVATGGTRVRAELPVPEVSRDGEVLKADT